MHRTAITFLIGAQAQSVMPLVSSAFGSGMVLQREPVSATLFGWTAPNVTVSITLDAIKPLEVQASALGKWEVSLPPTPAGVDHRIHVAADGSETVLEDVAFGEVWGCGGQSNMAYSVWMMGTGSPWKGHPGWNATEIIEDSANYPNLRLMSVHRGGSKTPQEEPIVSQPWMRASPELLNDSTKWGNFSAVCYLSGRDLFNKLGGNVPVGLVSSNVGGTQIQRWTPTEVVRECDSGVGGSDLYQGMIAPLTLMKFQGWLWYQGEQNIGGGRAGGFPGTGAEYYSCQFRNMISAWRDAFASPQMPFLFVQLAAFTDGYHYNITNQSLAELREAQASVLNMPRTGMATAFDLGMGGGVHPGTKTEVGLRMASVMSAIAYGNDEVHEGPTPSTALLQNGSVIITFDLKGSRGWDVHEGQNCSFSRHGEQPRTLAPFYCKSYEVQAADGTWTDATFSRLTENGAVEITSSVEEPIAVRYGWSDYPIVNLYNAEGFPTPPFQIKVSSSAVIV